MVHVTGNNSIGNTGRQEITIHVADFSVRRMSSSRPETVLRTIHLTDSFSMEALDETKTGVRATENANLFREFEFSEEA